MILKIVVTFLNEESSTPAYCEMYSPWYSLPMVISTGLPRQATISRADTSWKRSKIDLAWLLNIKKKDYNHSHYVAA